MNPNWDAGKEWILEIGPGNGKFLLWMAESNPQKLFIATEIRNMRYRKIAKKVEEGNLKNVVLIHGDARHCLPHLFEGQRLSEIYVLFPDPWPKRRHNKHRLLNGERIDLFHEILKKGGSVFIATDHAHYAEQIKKIFPEEKWRREEGRSLYPTYFETKWKNLGREIFYFRFVKI